LEYAVYRRINRDKLSERVTNIPPT
jgi:hypothetical protein